MVWMMVEWKAASKAAWWELLSVAEMVENLVAYSVAWLEYL